MTSGAELPADVLECVFSFVSEEDVVSCSGVNTRWHETAKRLLSHKHGIQLCRFDRISSKSRDVCLAGTTAVWNFSKRKLRKLRTLRIQHDEPDVPRSTTLCTIFASCKYLKRLELLNLTYLSKNDVHAILEKCNPGLELRISLRDRAKSKEALDILKEHRELFRAILLEYGKGIEGYFPIPGDNAEYSIPQNSQTVSLECLGLKELRISHFNSLRTLKLDKCHAMTDTSLHDISKLNVTTFSIRGCPASEATWLYCFEYGFRNLNVVSITKCENLTSAVVEFLGYRNLSDVELEINYRAEISGLPHLFRSSKLESLKIITDQIISNLIFEGVDNHWPNLKLLKIVESALFNDESRGNIEAIARISRFKQIAFHYYNNPTKIFETSRIKSRS